MCMCNTGLKGIKLEIEILDVVGRYIVVYTILVCGR